MTVTPRGVSASVGGKYARTTVHSSGRVTSSVSLPGTGISYVSTSGGQKRASTPSPRERVVAPARPVTPGAFAPRWEKALYKALAAGEVNALEGIARNDPAARNVCMVLDGFMYEGPDRDARIRPIFEDLWRSGFEPATDPFITKYVALAATTISIAPGVRAELPLSRDAIGLVLVELRQESGDLAGAVEVAESLEPSAPAAVSLAELYAGQERWNDVVDLTNGITGTDEFSTYLQIQRGVALRMQGFFDASREAFKPIIARRLQPPQLKHQALVERAMTYAAEGKKAMARKDLERVLAEDATYPGLADLLANLSA